MPRLADYDLADLDLFENGFPHPIFELHRREAPVYWHPVTSHTPDGAGFWSVATYAETLEIMRDATTFSSVGGGDRPRGGTILPDNVMAGRALNMMDDPRHQRVRRLVSHGFTPKMITRLESELRGRTRVILDRIAQTGACDFLVDVAAELPLQAITILMGVPEADRHDIFEWVEYSFDFRGRDAFEETEESRRAWGQLLDYATRLIAERRARPTDDMFSAVIHAELEDEDPPRLTDEELYSFFFLLFAAGSDTTRNAAAGGLLELIHNPRQLEDLAANLDLLPKAIEEMVRWTSPAAYNRRTATRDVEFHGHPIRAGDKVVFWEASANRDEKVFPHSMQFDVRRQPNPHLGFGHGVHHCLGANLARLEMNVIFEEFLGRFRSIALAGPPEWTRSNKHTGMRHLPIRFEKRAS
jgi:cytochrome P450